MPSHDVAAPLDRFPRRRFRCLSTLSEPCLRSHCLLQHFQPLCRTPSHRVCQLLARKPSFRRGQRPGSTATPTHPGTGSQTEKTNQAATSARITQPVSYPYDVRKHEPDPDPSFFGDEIGWWDGDTFVIDSTAFKEERTWIDENADPHSDQQHTMERWTRPDESHLPWN